MFTGLIEQLGTIEALERRDDGLSIRISCTLHPYELGESIAVNGTCLTVKSFSRTHFDADASLETLDKTNLSDLAEGARTHLERAMALGDRLGGHLVTGHVDGVGTLVEKVAEATTSALASRFPPTWRRSSHRKDRSRLMASV